MAGPLFWPSLSSLTLPASLASAEGAALNFLIGAFPVPPFLLPIYQAAAVDYAVPWEVLAAINEVETDFGRNLSTSSAGAVGWMQFMASTWARYGIDADRRGVANPYDPVDAIFSAARYLRAAGAEGDLAGAIFAYNHAGWYVNSVELRAQLFEYLPEALLDGLTGLMQASYPIAGHLGRYATDTARPATLAGAPGVILSAPAGAPVIASTDARVIAVGRDAQRGRYITIQDAYGNRFTYSGLTSVASLYPVLKPRVESALRLVHSLGLTSPPAGTTGSATVLRGSGSAPGVGGSGAAPPTARPAWISDLTQGPITPVAKERLFADPERPASYAAGGRRQIESSLAAYAAAADALIAGRGAADYFSQPLLLRPAEFTLAPLTSGSIVAAGTILGRVGRQRLSGRLVFQIRPAGAATPIDPRPIIAGWEVLGRLTAGRNTLVGGAFSGAFGGDNPSLGQLLLAAKPALDRAVLSDPRVHIDGCDRSRIRAGRIERRVLAVVEYLSYSGFAPTVSGLSCGNGDSVSESPSRFELTRLGQTPVAGHQRSGGIIDLAVRWLLGLQGSLRPSRIISLRHYPLQGTAVASSDHADRVEVDFAPASPDASMPGQRLDTTQWTRLIGRLARLANAGP